MHIREVSILVEYLSKEMEEFYGYASHRASVVTFLNITWQTKVNHTNDITLFVPCLSGCRDIC